MILLGIDPGIATTGYGVIREEQDGRVVAMAYGALLTPKTDSLPERLLSLRRQLIGLVEQWRPAESAVEALFLLPTSRPPWPSVRRAVWYW